MGLFDALKKKNKTNKMDILDIPYDYDGYDIVFKRGKTDVKLYDKFNKIVTNERFDINTLDEFKKLSKELNIDIFYEFYNS